MLAFGITTFKHAYLQFNILTDVGGIYEPLIIKHGFLELNLTGLHDGTLICSSLYHQSSVCFFGMKFCRHNPSLLQKQLK